ncbi:hypothetical protein [Streptomyces pseudovenezuelae]|uniref:hypothetical protein n=1 Tax=Streptomyces pseudovenezuelae TaxID=67350 RepID=UPI002E7FED83|nr:hypothetical protein [Streptomyces pseudovenezuelae]WUA88710.1 hypothetical protein OHO81_15990 [Streptomyces pseudovenezuelae]
MEDLIRPGVPGSTQPSGLERARHPALTELHRSTPHPPRHDRPAPSAGRYGAGSTGRA